MRTYIYILLSLFITSCQLDLDSALTLEKTAIFDVEIPDQLLSNTEYTISFKYALVDGCHTFYNVEKEAINTETLIITAFTQVQKDQSCTQMYSEQDFSFTFKPSISQTYFLKFWKGQDANGNDIYEELEVVIE